MTIVNDDSRAVNKLEASLTDDARIVIYNRHMFNVKATGGRNWLPFMCLIDTHRLQQKTVFLLFSFRFVPFHFIHDQNLTLMTDTATT